MRNLVYHNKRKTLTGVVWEINAEENISTTEQVINRENYAVRSFILCTH